MAYVSWSFYTGSGLQCEGQSLSMESARDDMMAAVTEQLGFRPLVVEIWNSATAVSGLDKSS